MPKQSTPLLIIAGLAMSLSMIVVGTIGGALGLPAVVGLPLVFSLFALSMLAYSALPSAENFTLRGGWVVAVQIVVNHPQHQRTRQMVWAV